MQCDSLFPQLPVPSVSFRVLRVSVPGFDRRIIGRLIRLPFQLATFLGSALLFFIQPLLAKQILPWFGGGSAVWSACLLFFQLGLVAGYAYAHLTRRLGPARQAVVHLTLLVISFALLPVAPGANWKPPDGEMLVTRVLWLLTANVGLPYILLAATAPLLQDWQARMDARQDWQARMEAPIIPPRDTPIPPDIAPDDAVATEAVVRAAPVRPEAPYRLYVLSNAGSLIALLAYPTLAEPRLPLAQQHLIWSLAFVAFVAICGWCTWLVRRRTATAQALTSVAVADDRPTPLLDRLLWVVLPAVGSGLLLATTSMLTQDVPDDSNVDAVAHLLVGRSVRLLNHFTARQLVLELEPVRQAL